MGDEPGDATLDAARTVDRVAALVLAGIPAPRAWRTAAARDPALRTLSDEQGGVGDALDRLARDRPTGPWSDVGSLWRIAERTGAPAAPTLAAIASALRDSAAAERAVAVALAGPTTSGRVVLALPLLGLALGAAVGADVITVLIGTPLGWACAILAGALVAAGRAWTRRLVRAATPGTALPALLLEAWAVALSAGGSWTEAERTVEAVLGGREVAVDEQRLLAETLDLARGAGVPAAGLLRACGADLRRRTATAGLVAAERLAVRLVLPLGVCILPAFVLVGIVPIVAGILSSTVDGLG